MLSLSKITFISTENFLVYSFWISIIYFRYQLENTILDNLSLGDGVYHAKIIVFKPNKQYTYPFWNKKNEKSVGFLTNESMIPRSKSFSLYPKMEQFDRVHHFLKNSK